MLIFPSFFNAGPATYEIEQSLRFNSADSHYLNRTPSSTGNQKTHTLSLWFKRGAITSGKELFCAYTNNSNRVFIRNNGNTFEFQHVIGGTSYSIQTSQEFRDPSAWYHLVYAVDTTQSTSSDRVKIYINGERVTAFSSASYPPQDSNLATNNTANHYLGNGEYNSALYSNYWDGYLAEVNFIDGSALGPDSFGKTNVHGVWTPVGYAGSYTGNSFYLKFASGDGTDSSGLSNTWTANNFTTSGTGTDVMSDTPTTNWCVMNPNDRGDSNTTLSNGNLSFAATSPWDRGVKGTFAVSSGKWYWEYTHGTISAGSQPGADLGITKYTSLIVGGPQGGATSTDSYILAAHDGDLHNGSYTGSSYGSSANSGDVISIALDLDNGKIWWAKNGTWFNSGNPASGTNAGYTGLSGTFFPLWYWGISPGTGGVNAALGFNFGQRAFAYTPPTGFKALNTKHLPAPTVTDGSEYFNTILYSGDESSPRALTGVGFQPDFVWIKSRNLTADHNLNDAVRGTSNVLATNKADSENNAYGYVSAFSSDGFSVSNGGTGNGEVNSGAGTYVAWNWKAGATPGFEIVTYTGNGYPTTNSQSIAHNLGVKPAFIAIKNRGRSSQWLHYVGPLGATKGMEGWHDADTAYTNANYFNNTEPTSTHFTVGYDSGGNWQNENFVAYLWAEVDGFFKVGTYERNGSSDGPYIHLGFAPALVIIKEYAAGTEGWSMIDSKRPGYNPNDNPVLTDRDNSESYMVSTYVNDVDLLSNGFKIRNNDSRYNSTLSSYRYLYFAWAENPFGGDGVSPATAR